MLKYIWQKRVEERWLRIRSEGLTQRFGTALALVERPASKRRLMEISCRTRGEARKLVEEFGGRIERLRPNWLEHFTKQARGKPVRIGSRLLILSAPPERARQGQRNPPVRAIIIPAEAAFGTGEHATTAMCLRLLERVTRRLRPGWTMLDAGTGSGILAIAGSCLGAKRVVAIDSDPLACSTAKRNARVNRAGNLIVVSGDILKQKLTETFEVVTANLFSEILIEALSIWSRHLGPGSHLILSGILRSQESAVVRALRQHRFTISEIRRRGKWVALRAQRSPILDDDSATHPHPKKS